jgi:putative hydrolase of the HAD superfamily
MLRLADFDAVTFDVYGTLIDWEPSIAAFLRRIADRHGVAGDDAKLMADYDRIRADVQKLRPTLLYPDVLRRSYERVCADWNIPPDPAEREAFAAGPCTWLPYPDSTDALTALQRRVRIAALSNIDEASLTVTCGKLGIAFDLVVTAERVGAYKPELPHFHTALAELRAMGISRERVLHVAQSLRADIAPANALGLRCVWVNRKGCQLGLAGEGAQGARPDLTVSSLAELLPQIGLGPTD